MYVELTDETKSVIQSNMAQQNTQSMKTKLQNSYEHTNIITPSNKKSFDTNDLEKLGVSDLYKFAIRKLKTDRQLLQVV